MTSTLSKTHIATAIGLLCAIATSVVIGVVFSRKNPKKTATPKISKTLPQNKTAPPQRPRPRFKPRFKTAPINTIPEQNTPEDPQTPSKPNHLAKPSKLKSSPSEQPKIYTNKDKPRQTGPFEYKDPTNKKILGPSAWMAQPTEAQRKSIDTSLDNSPAKAEQEKNQRRATAYKQATQLAQKAQAHCLNKWPLKTIAQPRRVLLSMALEQRPKYGRVRKAIVLSDLNIDSDDHLTCLTDTLYNARTDVNIPMWITLKIPLTY